VTLKFARYNKEQKTVTEVRVCEIVNVISDPLYVAALFSLSIIKWCHDIGLDFNAAFQGYNSRTPLTAALWGGQTSILHTFEHLGYNKIKEVDKFLAHVALKEVVIYYDDLELVECCFTLVEGIEIDFVMKDGVDNDVCATTLLGCAIYTFQLLLSLDMGNASYRRSASRSKGIIDILIANGAVIGLYNGVDMLPSLEELRIHADAVIGI
jgi:hypothetical protein